MKATLVFALAASSFLVSGKSAKDTKTVTDVPRDKWTFTTKTPDVPYATGLIHPPAAGNSRGTR